MWVFLNDRFVRREEALGSVFDQIEQSPDQTAFDVGRRQLEQLGIGLMERRDQAANQSEHRGGVRLEELQVAVPGEDRDLHLLQ